ncbi:MAG: macrolide family glycosyltransferase [Chloroflexota bacterium]
MAKIAFINIPAYGHTNPTLPVVRELVSNGHHVLYYSSNEFREIIESTGVDFRSYAPDVPLTKTISERMKSMVDASLTMMEMSQSLTAWMLQEMRREQPDLIIYDTTCMWGYIPARILNIPSICSITHFLLDGSQKHLPIGTMFNYILSVVPKLPHVIQWKRTMTNQFGKDVVGGITEYADLNIVFTSSEFHPENKFVDERFQFVGPSIDEKTRQASDFKITHDGTTVYISLGTINNLKHDFYRTVFDAFKEYPAKFILSVGQHTDIATLQPIPDNFAVYPYVPQLQVLQQVDVFITHGGMNSVHEGLYYGVPEIVVPQQIEQLLNGIRVEEVGAGILLGRKPPYGIVTVSELQSALDSILQDSSYREQARLYGSTLKSAGGFPRAVEVIEAYLSESMMQLQPA